MAVQLTSDIMNLEKLLRYYKIFQVSQNTNVYYFIFQLPLDLSSLSEPERKSRIEKRKPKRIIKIEEEVIDNFSSSKYLKYMKKQ